MPVAKDALRQLPVLNGDGTVSESLPPPEKRVPGRPLGSLDRRRQKMEDFIVKTARPIEWQCKAFRDGWIKVREQAPTGRLKWRKEPLNADAYLSLAIALGRKVLPDLKPADIGIEINNSGLVLQVITGLSRRPSDPIDPPALDAALSDAAE